jgi:hypothetical protein
MPIPTWSVIADNEIDPESPITTSLMFRLRDNVLAVLGIDPADPAPVFTIPPSTQQAELNDTFWATGAGVAITTAEMIVSVVADDVEWVELAHSGMFFTNDVPLGGVAPHVGSKTAFSDTGGVNHAYLIVAVELSLIDVIYSGGVPTGVRICSRQVEGTVVNEDDVIVTLANTWQTILPDIISTSDLQAKARATSTEVYLQLRVNGSMASGSGFISIPFNRRSFRSKAAV